MNSTFDAISVALIWYSAVPATLFPAIYWRRRLPSTGKRAWRSSLYGWALMISGVALALVLDLTILFRVLGVLPGAHLVQMIVFALIALGSTFMCAAVIKAGMDD